MSEPHMRDLLTLNTEMAGGGGEDYVLGVISYVINIHQPVRYVHVPIFRDLKIRMNTQCHTQQRKPLMALDTQLLTNIMPGRVAPLSFFQLFGLDHIYTGLWGYLGQ